jgi:rRNA maturation protein Rpf1
MILVLIEWFFKPASLTLYNMIKKGDHAKLTLYFFFWIGKILLMDKFLNKKYKNLSDRTKKGKVIKHFNQSKSTPKHTPIHPLQNI